MTEGVVSTVMHVAICLQNSKLLLEYLEYRRCNQHVKIKVKGPKSKVRGFQEDGTLPWISSPPNKVGDCSFNNLGQSSVPISRSRSQARGQRKVFNKYASAHVFSSVNVHSNFRDWSFNTVGMGATRTSRSRSHLKV